MTPSNWVRVEDLVRHYRDEGFNEQQVLTVVRSEGYYQQKYNKKHGEMVRPNRKIGDSRSRRNRDLQLSSSEDSDGQQYSGWPEPGGWRDHPSSSSVHSG